MLERTVAWSSTAEIADVDSLGYEPSERPAIPLPRTARRADILSFPKFDASSPRKESPLDHSDEIRWLDLTVAWIALIFFAPLMGLIAVAILMDGPGPIFYRQSRLGFGGRVFPCLKFRTMRHQSADVLTDLFAKDPVAKLEWDRSQKLRRDPRVSLLGSFLRKTSLDELPQIFNVLAGDMSIVGPRPIVPEEAYRYRRYIRSYFSVKPGITGLWQISGRNHTTYRRRVACDVQYARNRTAYRDVAIIALTVPTVLTGRGAY